jgi:hypothetical protein
LNIHKEDKTSSICPNCFEIIPKQITRKMSCPFCKKVIYVRQGKPVTDGERFIIDWQKYMEFLVPDITKIRETVERALILQFGTSPSPRDLIWGMFNHIAARLRNPNQLEIIYMNMATFLTEEGDRKGADELSRSAHKMSVLKSIEIGFDKGVLFKNAEDDFVCEECKKINGTMMSLQEAYENFPLPVSTCTNKKCRCSHEYLYEPLADKMEAGESKDIKNKSQKSPFNIIKKIFK